MGIHHHTGFERLKATFTNHAALFNEPVRCEPTNTRHVLEKEIRAQLGLAIDAILTARYGLNTDPKKNDIKISSFFQEESRDGIMVLAPSDDNLSAAEWEILGDRLGAFNWNLREASSGLDIAANFDNEERLYQIEFSCPALHEALTRLVEGLEIDNRLAESHLNMAGHIIDRLNISPVVKAAHQLN